MLYLDHAATTPVRPAAVAAMEPYLGETFGNPSGIHRVSQAAKHALESCRERAADLIGAAHPDEIVFTGGGTESDNLGVLGPALAATGPPTATVTAVEHEAVLEAGRFLERRGGTLRVVAVDSTGIVDPDEFADAASTAVVASVMAANNETGVLQPVRKSADAIRGSGHRTPVHTDAVQAFVSEAVAVPELGADLVTLASHKLGGPKGVGLLYVRRGIDLEPVLHGGGQERGRRSGTHNVAGIVGMVTAMEEAVAGRGGFRKLVGGERNSFEQALADAVPDVEFTVAGAPRLVQHSHLRIPGIDAETLLIRLDAVGVAAAAGSACHSGAVEPSHVLTAMGIAPAAAGEYVRITFGWTNRVGDGEKAAVAVAGIAVDLR